MQYLCVYVWVMVFRWEYRKAAEVLVCGDLRVIGGPLRAFQIV